MKVGEQAGDRVGRRTGLHGLKPHTDGWWWAVCAFRWFVCGLNPSIPASILYTFQTGAKHKVFSTDIA